MAAEKLQLKVKNVHRIHLVNQNPPLFAGKTTTVVEKGQNEAVAKSTKAIG